jgi:hypothetical protein
MTMGQPSAKGDLSTRSLSETARSALDNTPSGTTTGQTLIRFKVGRV